jgi:signal transduction histidine kinase/CheY-like chemotaxis protein
MSAQESGKASTWSSDLAAFIEQLQSETLSLALPGICVAGVILLSSVWVLPDPLKSTVPALALFLLVVAVWIVRRWNYTAAAWVLVIGCLATNLLVVTWCDLVAAVCLLAVPVGLATLAISRAAGVGMAGACTFLLLFAPPTLLPDTSALRTVALMGMWGTVGMIWLTLRPLLAAVQWAWSGYEQSQTLLEQARDYQVQLHETLEDLTAANVQLTRLNQQAQALRQAAEDERRAKEQFVANVSHELRTPLNMIIGFCEMITQAPETYGWGIPETLLADLAVVLRNSQHLSSLIDDVLDLSQIEAGQMALTKERVSLAEVVQAATVAVRPLFASKGLALETGVPEDLPLVFCDRTRIREVVLNLLSNAGRFTEQGGVQVRAWQEGNDVVVSVADTGPGIAEEDKDRLFRPFQQLDGTIRRRYGGTGLGLSISKSFVELHDGKMWVESEPGRGTTVFFRLPIDPPAPLDSDALRWFNPYQPYQEHHRPFRLRPAPVRPRLIVMEGGNSMQRLLGRYLDGAEITPVANFEEALQELSQVPAQALLINDVRVGETLQQVNQSTALPYGLPALICSIPGVEQAAGALGVSDYLLKPVSREVLMGAMDRLEREVKTVLMVDDEPDAVRLFQRMLVSADRGYRVLRAFDGRQALEILRREQVDVILLDLIMPAMDGFQFLAAKSQDAALRDVPVILISARDPMGQPIVSNALAVTCRGGLSIRQLLACIEAVSTILSPAGLPVDPTSPAASPG